MSKKFDYIVLGSGPAAYGLTTALKAAGSTKTALIIDNDLFREPARIMGANLKSF
ncbi:hypothetical protein [Levilactobacillus yonginensis]|uniref:hypothetical protein n=1 Tax=Levilactobacillus yonginensis TaxID=1054041 RepID=UPI00345D9727